MCNISGAGTLNVTPAKAGAHVFHVNWMPAFAGMAVKKRFTLRQIILRQIILRLNSQIASVRYDRGEFYFEFIWLISLEL